MTYVTTLKPEGTVIRLEDAGYTAALNAMVMQGMVSGAWKFFVWVENDRGFSKVLETEPQADGAVLPMTYEDPVFGQITIYVDLACEQVRITIA